ncbi:hypothetical protein [Capnocytophaga catalasegens]|uniref:Uncharacterized protein n=1 Tax=Capnocytophaga catalasegens TaxID=1004260 RepID=A0AAV5AQU6_9FLAO|nr:hypothetical protein [Capnocytophaga catalasegens]GIZ15146.1 hypothetical protein RCZ03_11460 [Capnocytophaga catalasegens]GJM49661.1 hypothetical protein RCZ15_06360 [Capnocytophaga catalasegens]GJM52726.1 hypothetical protein RCZ16_10430 [Capnocytophaga catalasegens]
MNNLWILTEERPKKQVLAVILQKFTQDYKLSGFIDSIRILPILQGGKFAFTYEVTGFRCNKVNKVYIKTVSGNSSFTDFLIFNQKEEPKQKDIPIYAIEETKTDDKESRNTGVYQRCSKFVFIDSYYPNAKKIMLYNLQIEQKEKPTETYIFGTRLLLTLGVEILGKKLDKDIFIPFEKIDEVIDFKNNMRHPPKGNVPILLNREKDKIEISGRLFKSNGLSHDPNIGALSIISAVLRKLGWEKRIVITQHGLEQNHIGKTNKFIQIANKIGIELDKLTIPKVEMNKSYWKYDKDGEKLGTIFIHLVVENFTQGYSIFENHAGSEKGYFIPKQGDPIPLAKYKDREKYKAGNKDEIIHIPDLILFDFDRNEVINIEGKKYQFRHNGISELANYDYIEKHYIKKYYPKSKIIRTVVLYGSKETRIIEIEIGFLLNEKGQLILGIKAPRLFQEAIKNLLDFWN